MMQLLVRAEFVLSGWRCLSLCVCVCGDADEANDKLIVKRWFRIIADLPGLLELSLPLTSQDS